MSTRNPLIGDRFQLEVCAASPHTCQIAAAAGANRVELCTALVQGGTTPSYAAIVLARKVEGIALHVLIRPRAGDFVYTPQEVQEMELDIRMARELGADGVVFGCLTPQGGYDYEANGRLLQAAQGMSVTFHRAFDAAADSKQLLEILISEGYRRVLTSGGYPNVTQGMHALRDLVDRAAGRIGIMCGGGVRLDNLQQLIRTTGATQFHGTFKQMVPSASAFRHPAMKAEAVTIDPYAYQEGDGGQITGAVSLLKECARL